MFFTTLTLADEILISSLESLLDTISNKWLYVHEYGKTENNHHIHIIFDPSSEKEERTDNVTRKFKILYPSSILCDKSSKGVLIKTKIAKTWQKLYKNYLVKEQQNKRFDGLKFRGFDERILKKLYKESGIDDVMTGYVYVSFKKAPYAIIDYMTKKEVPYFYHSLPILEDMLKDGYIVHHLIDDKQLQKIDWAVSKLYQGPKKKSQFNII